ncbi:MAG: permease, partial [Alphaproteobacteria bacterium]|nr:permease [Alphaproteobacteria bacterium]
RHAKSLASVSGRLVVHKMGANGCIAFLDDRQFDVPIFPVKALKPTGAGDAFMGGFIAGLVAGIDVPAAVLRGAATAAIVVTKIGCSPAMPSATAVHAFMQKHLN